jgi:hypothetical protein
VSTLSKGRQIIEDGLDRIFPKRRVFLPAGTCALLRRHPLRIVDVGGAMGPDERWKPLAPGHCVIFELDAKADSGQVAG